MSEPNYMEAAELLMTTDWQAEEVAVGEGQYKRTHVLYKRSVVDVIRELIGNPAFANVMRYALERHWTSMARRSRVYGEMWTGNWWWRRQKFLADPWGTIAPLIVASDKTQMTKLAGNQSAHPVYLSIGNISKTIRRKASSHATVIIGYLPTDDFKDVPSKVLRGRLKGQLLHYSMASLMKPLEEAGRSGVDMWCADGYLRRVYPLLAAFVGDFPEQSDMSCTSQGGCPKCLKRWHGRGDEHQAAPRTRISTLLAIDNYLASGRARPLKALKLKPWWPWWADLPGCEFANAIMPDLLHQLHKGLFKDHALRWAQQKIGKGQLDNRFQAMPRASSLRHFKRGISTVKQWTGRETKEMEKVFLPILADDRKIPNDLVALIWAMLDFAYLAHSARLTEGELESMRQAHADMHRLKNVLVQAGIYASLEHLDCIPKWHMVSHYVGSIRELGTPDGYNTESPEYLHIVYVKQGWAASSKRDAIPQIIAYCQQLEALRIHCAHLCSRFESLQDKERPKLAILVGDNDGDYQPNDLDNGEEAWEDVGVDEDDGHEGDRRPTTIRPDPDEVEHPAPEFAIALQPTRKVTMTDIISNYGANNFERSLRAFLRPYAHGHYWILASDTFDMWHKLILYHQPLSFAPDEPSHQDTIRVRPPTHNAQSYLRYHLEPAFDTALFLHDTQQAGIHCYRAGRVRAIFRLPERLRYLYDGELVYLELFTGFNAHLSDIHRLHTTSQSRGSNGNRPGIVIPIQNVKLGCHLVPQFRHVPRNVTLDSNVNLLDCTRQFFFNHYYNHYTFQLIQYWRHLVETAA
ncbi:Zn-finger protein [Ceratobasidium sp. AG-Ba]|nr:Zn-finger protein [Ceratobasidium sp. AG-Ba]